VSHRELANPNVSVRQRMNHIPRRDNPVRCRKWYGWFLLMLVGVYVPDVIRAGPGDEAGRLTQLSLEELANIQVTSVSKEPEKVRKTAAAIFVITQQDIRRSGATCIPEILRLAPGVEVARVDSDHWSVGIRGFGGVLSSKLLVLIDGRSVYTPLYAGVY